MRELEFAQQIEPARAGYAHVQQCQIDVRVPFDLGPRLDAVAGFEDLDILVCAARDGTYRCTNERTVIADQELGAIN